MAELTMDSGALRKRRYVDATILCAPDPLLARSASVVSARGRRRVRNQVEWRVHTAFRFRLLQSRVMPTNSMPDPAEQRLSAKARHVLVIDDDAQLSMACRTVLEDAGYAVDTAANGAEGVRLVRDLGADVLLCDVEDQDMEGLAALRGAAPGIPVVAILRGDTTPLDAHAVTERLGAVATLAKPFSSPQLLEAIRTAHGEEPSPSSGHPS